MPDMETIVEPDLDAQTPWDRLMDDARRQAKANGERRKVVAVQTTPRGERVTGMKWRYIVQCGSECVVCHQRRGAARSGN